MCSPNHGGHRATIPHPRLQLVMTSQIEARVRQQLQQIHPVTLQKLAGDLACVRFPDRFRNRVLRRAHTWRSHLDADLSHAADPYYRNLSGYIFVGGYPGEAPTAAQIDGWVDRFVALGLDRAKVTILVGADLVAELCRPEYAALRQIHLGLAAAPEWFRLLGYAPINDRRLGPFQPTQEEYDHGLAGC